MAYEEQDAPDELDYEPPALVEYGTIEAWTRGIHATGVSIVL
jgi:hypothetical protein